MVQSAANEAHYDQVRIPENIVFRIIFEIIQEIFHNKEDQHQL
jgi:hypothetical protein